MAERQEAIKIYIGPSRNFPKREQSGWHVDTLGSSYHIRGVLQNSNDIPVLVHGEDAQACIADVVITALTYRASLVEVPLTEISTHDEGDQPLMLRAWRLAHRLGDQMDDPRLQIEPVVIWEAGKNKAKAYHALIKSHYGSEVWR